MRSRRSVRRACCAAVLGLSALACASAEYTPGVPQTATGRAPKVRVHALSEQAGRQTLVIAFGPGDDVLQGLAELARARGWKSAHFSGIGSFSRATLGSFDSSRKEFLKIPKQGLLEVASFGGNVTLGPEDAAIVHAHCALADESGEMSGGHLLEATVAVTLEVFLTVEPTAVRKAQDDALGSKVIQ